MKSVNSENLARFQSLTVKINSSLIFSNVNPPDNSNANSLVFVSTKQMFETALKNNVHGFIILEKIYSDVENLLPANSFVATTSNIHFAMSEIIFLFDENKIRSEKIHPTAVISPTAKIGKNVSISAYAVIEDFSVIEDSVVIGAHTVIEHHAVILENTELSAHVFIGSHCQIGKNCKISPQTVIGADGFGYFTDATFTHHKIAQIGIVVLEDNVELGAHCAVDRAALTETRIKKGSKLDNFCHIAHNVEIGENAILAAAFKVAGSTKIGKNLMSSGGIDINGHVTIADNVILTARTGITASVENSGIYGGFPAVPHKDNLKIMATVPHLPKIKKQIAQIMKHLGLE
jgi:UDP-3-O-[3-hydroxymyristoyl] glucosamine N-acyltransferase